MKTIIIVIKHNDINDNNNQGVAMLIKTLEKNKIDICLFTKLMLSSFCHEKGIIKITVLHDSLTNPKASISNNKLVRLSPH